MVIKKIIKSINSTSRHILTSAPIPAFLAHLGLVFIQTRYNINPQSGKKKISVKKCGQIILLILQGRVCRQECSIRLPSGMKDISQLPHRIQSIRSNRCSLLFVRRSAHWVGSDIYGLQNKFQKVERIWKPGC